MHGDLYETAINLTWQERPDSKSKDEDKAQKAPENSSTRCSSTDGGAKVESAASQAGPQLPENKYPLPPTGIHDGLLFRKVG